MMDLDDAQPFVKRDDDHQLSLTSIRKRLTADPNGYAGAQFASDVRSLLERASEPTSSSKAAKELARKAKTLATWFEDEWNEKASKEGEEEEEE